jgi:catechol 2,3-dioxygenase-like lactoylglutathione lyase family enzyme
MLSGAAWPKLPAIRDGIEVRRFSIGSKRAAREDSVTVQLNHVNIRAQDLAATVAFYTEAIGLKEGWRPAFDFPGAWLYDDARPVVHLVLGGGQADDVVVDHVAFAVDALDPVLARLDALNLRTTPPRPVPGTDIRQCFLKDPNGVTVELQGP